MFGLEMWQIFCICGLIFVGLVVAPILAGIFPAPPLEKWSEDQNEK